MTATIAMLIVDLAAICALVFGVYFPRHHRADLIVAFLGVNIGVLGVSIMLAGSEVSMGLGLGLFGVLSIIRLRSSEISQREVAYYFAALAIGLICGMSTTVNYLAIGMVLAIVAVLALADSPRLFGEFSTQEIMLDRAITDPAELKEEVARTLGAVILSAQVLRLDLVNDTTLVSVRTRRQVGDQAGNQAGDQAGNQAERKAAPEPGTRREAVGA